MGISSLRANKSATKRFSTSVMQEILDCYLRMSVVAAAVLVNEVDEPFVDKSMHAKRCSRRECAMCSFEWRLPVDSRRRWACTALDRCSLHRIQSCYFTSYLLQTEIGTTRKIRCKAVSLGANLR
jgi:hypothetical protein